MFEQLIMYYVLFVYESVSNTQTLDGKNYDVETIQINILKYNTILLLQFEKGKQKKSLKFTAYHGPLFISYSN